MKYLWTKLGIITFWLSWPLIWMVIKRTRRTRVIIRSNDEVLLARNWLSAGLWGLPGGGLRAGEDPLTGAVREVHEEMRLSLDPKQLHFLGKTEAVGSGLSAQIFTYYAELPESSAVIPKKLEIVGARWFPIEGQLHNAAIEPEAKRAMRLIKH